MKEKSVVIASPPKAGEAIPLFEIASADFVSLAMTNRHLRKYICVF